MKKIILFAGLISIFSSVAHSELRWETDLEKAKLRSENENKPLFIIFVGSDWCPWCKKFNTEIINTPQFDQYAHNKLVLLKCDFPKHSKIDELELIQNSLLKDQYGINGFPSVVVLGASGSQIMRMGYQKGGPDSFLVSLDTTVQKYGKN